MLSSALMGQVVQEAHDYWIEEAAKPYFARIAQGKEVGHRIADLVDEKTDALLTLHHRTRHQYNSQGSQRARSMGDVWLLDGEIYHPVNIKTGIVGSEGQPNLASLRKVLSAILNHQIDSYYLLMVKILIRGNPPTIEPRVIFTDMLDWLDYVTFDAGPGQMMLKAKAFFENYDSGTQPTLTVVDKVSRLVSLYEDGLDRLWVNREKALTQIRDEVNRFHNEECWAVTPATQESLLLQ